jgi:hypothetical protein
MSAFHRAGFGPRFEEASMRAQQKVRFKPASPLGRSLKIPREAEGSVLCRYRLLRGDDKTPQQLDVRFGPHLVVWGAPDDQFETVGEEAN